MADAKDSQTTVNDSRTPAGFGTKLTHACSGFDLEDARRDLIALRVRHGANSPIGHRASLAAEQLMSGYLTGLQRTLAELAELTKAA